GVDKFKYITFQSPIPKCPTLWNPPNMADESHVTSQYLANVWDGMTVWLLPPFNADHIMIDDIGLEKITCGNPRKTISSEAGNILGDVPALEFHYVEESTEGRFDTSLAERHAYDGYDEIWNWWSIFTKPYQYTELWLPDQETASNADGNEYLITTSFIAPNCEDEERTEFCKSDREVHDIIDRASTLMEPVTPAQKCGDVTGDGNVNMGDVTLLLNHVGYPSNSAYDIPSDWVGDVTGDGNVNMGDVTLLLNHVGYPSNSAYDLKCAGA
ncbi:MAG: dockerin type I repeat-containing protein, partial [Euryarchaeota archaeon]|nr:dockerin type I repeat-containing protein [Euryarchaeota archaeon]